MDPLNGDEFLHCPDTQPDELEPFVKAMRAVPKSGLHNPLKNPDKYAIFLGSRASAENVSAARRELVGSWSEPRGVAASARGAGRGGGRWGHR